MNTNPNIDLTLNLDEVNILLSALQEVAAKVANPLTAKITEQAKAQLEPLAPQAEAE